MRCRIIFFVIIFVSSLVISGNRDLLAQENDVPPEVRKNAYRKNAYHQLLASADKNHDGKITMQECRATSLAKTREQRCSYWDANGDEVITEDEYVQQLKNLRLGNWISRF